MNRFPQVKRLATTAQLRARLAALGVELPLDDDVDPRGVLSTPVRLTGDLVAPNRFAILPMEGWDGDRDGRPTELVRRRWARFGAAGAGLVWGEATAVRHDGRANPRQLVLDESTVDDLAALRGLLPPGPVAGLQLTHSGRYARPDGVAAPRTASAHPVLDRRVGASAADVIGDDELDELVERFVAAARLAAEAGFDFVDVKCCHGYLVHELLGARDRPGRYGGDLANRTRFLRDVVGGIRARVPGLAVAVRLSLFDVVPHVPGPDGVGVPEVDGDLGQRFGTDGGELHAVLDELAALGVGIVGATGASPYTAPHAQRPAYFPPSDGYLPPEDPLVGVARLVGAAADVAARHPSLAVVAGGCSYLQEWLPNVAQAVVASGGAAMVGLGRMALSYPHLAGDVLAGRPLDRRLVCRTFSDCTTAPRAGLVSGCYPLDAFYRDRPERVELARAKRAARPRP